MQLVEIFLPIVYNNKEKVPQELFKQTYEELIEEFGGLTAYTRASVQGYWQNEKDSVVTDELIIYEILDDHFSSDYWNSYRKHLEKRFKQERLMIRTYPIQLL